MSKNIICFIECSSTGAGEACAREAQILGYKTILISRNPKQYSNNILKHIDKTIVCETNNGQNILLLFDSDADLINTSAVMTTNDFYVRQTSFVCAKLGLANIGIDASEACHFKKIMRERFDATGFSNLNPRYIIQSIDMLEREGNQKKITKSIGFPFVIKPIDGNDSLGVNLIKTEEEFINYTSWTKNLINDATEQKFSRKFLIEEFIDAEEFSVEVLVNKPNEPIIIGSFIKELWGKKNAPFIKIGSAFPYQGPKTHLIRQEIPKAVKAIEAKKGILNIDCKIYNNTLKIIEINGRMVGDQMGSHIIPMATGYNLAKAAVQLSLGLEPDDYNNSENKFIGIYRVLPNKWAKFNGIENKEKIEAIESVRSLQILASVGKNLKEPASNQDVVASVICEGSNPENALITAKKIASSVIINYA